MELLLFIVASILKWILSPLLWLFGVITSIIKKEHKKYFKDLAIAKDQYGNTVGKYAFNLLLITKEGYSFGNIDETISSCIGKNKIKGTLSRFGRVLDYILNSLDKDHSIRAIDKSGDEFTKELRNK